MTTLIAERPGLIKNKPIAKILNVTTGDVNEKGVMNSCTILQEVTNINDNAIIAAFGKLNYAGISVASYNIYIHTEVLLGDRLKIESTHNVSQNRRLTVIVTIRKANGDRNTPVLTGSFTFINNNQND